MAENQDEATRVAVQILLNDYDAFLFDCDGTLYQAATLLPNVVEALRMLRGLGKKVAFVTNTSSRSAVQLQAKLQKFGIECSASECTTSGTFSAKYIKEKHPGTRRVYVIGGQGLADELAHVGIESEGIGDSGKVFEDTEYREMAERVGQSVFDGVIVGYDTSFNYYKLASAALVFQRHPECFFYVTNTDPTDLVGGHLMPGTGCMLPAIEAVCSTCAPHRASRAAPFSDKARALGKPSEEIAREICAGLGVDCQRAVMVGDRLDTDIKMAVLTGMGSLFVLSGVDGVAQIEEKGIRPRFTLPDVGSLWTHRPQQPRH